MKINFMINTQRNFNCIDYNFVHNGVCTCFMMLDFNVHVQKAGILSTVKYKIMLSMNMLLL